MNFLPVDTIMIIFENISLIDVRSLYLAYRKQPTETILKKLSYFHNISYEDNIDSLIISSLKNPIEKYIQALNMNNYNLCLRCLPNSLYLITRWRLGCDSDLSHIFKSNLTTNEKDSLILHTLNDDIVAPGFFEYCLGLIIDAKHYKLAQKFLVKYPKISVPSYMVGKILKKAPLEDLEPLLPHLTINCLNTYDVDPTKDVRRILMVKPYLGKTHQIMDVDDMLDPYKLNAFEELELIVKSIGWNNCHSLNKFALRAIMAKNIPIIDLLSTQRIPYLLYSSDFIFENSDILKFILSHSYLKTILPYDFLFQAIQNNSQNTIKILYEHNIPFDAGTIISLLKNGFNEGAKYAEKIYGNSEIVEYYRRVLFNNPVNDTIFTNLDHVIYNVVITCILTVKQ
jgi:hypothetical protein